MLTNKLVNPTPFDASFRYHRGIILKIPADGSISLTLDQMEDFAPGKPGSEEVQKQLNFFGMFLLDGDRSYDEQALNGLEVCYRERKAQYDAFVTNERDRRLAIGAAVDEVTLKEFIRKQGYNIREKELESLSARIDLLKAEHVEKRTAVREALDPERTCFGCNPPREFPSKTALKMFLSDASPEVVAKHESYLEQLND